jgi:aryl-alcohol dehydrogenase-like predicted oxidoreductase
MQCGEALGRAISRMTLGTVQLGKRYGIVAHTGQPDESGAFGILDAAREAGVSLLDTGRMYGDSERVIGAYRAQRPAAGFALATKFAVPAAEPPAAPHAAPIFAHSAAPRAASPSAPTSAPGGAAAVEALIRDQLRESLRLLGAERVFIYWLHSAGAMASCGGEIARALRRLRAEGLIERAGVSVYEAGEIDMLLEDDIYEAVQLPVSVLDTRLVESGHIGRLQKAGRTVFARSVFLQGLITLRGDELPGKYAFAGPCLARLRGLAAEFGRSPAETALVFARDLEGVSSLVLGAKTAAQARESALLFDAPPLSGPEREALTQLSREAPIEDIMRAIRATP